MDENVQYLVLSAYWWISKPISREFLLSPPPPLLPTPLAVWFLSSVPALFRTRTDGVP